MVESDGGSRPGSAPAAPRPFVRRHRPHLLALAAFVLLAVIHTWPLASRPGYYSRVDNGDYLLNAWVLDWVATALPTRPGTLFDANIFHPEKNTLAYSEPLLLQGVLAMPLVWSGASAVTTFNVVLMAGLALSGWAFAWYCQSLTGSWWAGTVAGSMAIFNAHNLMRLAHIQALHLETVPLVFLGLQHMAAQGRPRDALLAGLALASQALISLYQFVFVAWALVCGMAARLLDAMRPLRLLLLTAAAVAVAAVAAWPVLMHYAELRYQYGLKRSPAEAAMYASSWRDYLYTGARVHFDLWSHAFKASDGAFPGVLGAVLAVWGLLTTSIDRRHVRTWLFVFVGALALSLLPHLPGFAMLHAWLPPLQVIRAYSRAGQMALVAVAMLAGFGLAAALQRWPSRAGAIGLAAVVLVNAEALRAPLWWAPFAGISPVYATLAAEPNAVVAEMPVFRTRSIFGNARYMLNATVHRHPIVNGYSGFMPPSYGPMQASVASFPEGKALAALHALGVTHVVVHANMMSGPRLDRIAQSPALARVASDGPITIYRLRSGGTSP
jgi:hypothetical protein